MINKMELEPEEVIKQFHINAGLNPYIPESIDKQALIEGLRFLLNSDFNSISSLKNKPIFIHGSMDKILPFRALSDLKKLYPSAETHLISGFHWIPFKILNTYIPR